MSRLSISTGTSPNDGLGDTILNGVIKINSNFVEIYNCIGNGTTITNSIGYASSAGISTYATSAGIATYATNAGVATYATSAGVATYATSAGVATFAQGLIGTPNIVVGITTFSQKISAGNTTGNDGQYLRSTGIGVTWSSFPTLRTGFSTTATLGQNNFSTPYNVGFVDIYINGVKLNETTFTASTSPSITLNDPCFGGESVEIISYNTTSNGSGNIITENYWTTNTTGIHTLSNVGIGTTNSTSKLTVIGDVKVGINTNNGLIMTSPNGTKYRLIVDNFGILSTSLVS
jgi:hypothetical protein